MSNMIKRLAFTTNGQALALLQLQMAAYQVEVRLIGFGDLPLLKDTIASIQQSPEAFYGYFERSSLVGAISVKDDEKGGSTICRMMVDPNYFRKGIASALLQHVLTARTQAGTAGFTVSTAARNIPALRLYERFGFRERSRTEIGPGIEMVTLARESLIDKM